jgi:hypothetical protein
MPNIHGIEKIKGTRIIGSRHSVPPHMTQPYVTMFMLRKQEERLEKEGIRLDTKRELIVERLKEIEKETKRLENQDRKTHKKREFDPDTIWMKVKKEATPEEPNKPKTGTVWKITTLKRKKQHF